MKRKMLYLVLQDEDGKVYSYIDKDGKLAEAEIHQGMDLHDDMTLDCVADAYDEAIRRLDEANTNGRMVEIGYVPFDETSCVSELEGLIMNTGYEVVEIVENVADKVLEMGEKEEGFYKSKYFSLFQSFLAIIFDKVKIKDKKTALVKKKLVDIFLNINDNLNRQYNHVKYRGDNVSNNYYLVQNYPILLAHMNNTYSELEDKYKEVLEELI